MTAGATLTLVSRGSADADSASDDLAHPELLLALGPSTVREIGEAYRALVPPESDDAKWLNEAIAKTRAQMGGPVAAAQTAAHDKKPAPARATSTASTAITGRLTLSPELAAKVPPSDTVFVFARNPQGSRVPLAVQRAKVADLPLSFKLDDSMAMSPEFKLSSASEVRIEARVSRSGSATPSPGDLIGVGPVVKPGANQVAVQIDQVRP